MDNEEISHVAGPRFAPSTATASPSAQSQDMAMISEVPTGSNAVHPQNQHADLGGWAPDVLDELDMYIALTIEADVEVDKDPMSSTMSTMAAFRRRVCHAFNLDDNDRSDVSQIKRGLESAVMCGYDRCADEGHIDLPSAKLFALLFEGLYRSHGDNLFEYGNGSRHRPPCLSAPSLQYATHSIRYAQSLSTLMANGDFPSRDYDGVSESGRLILDSKTIDGMKETSLLGQPDKKPARPFYCVEL